MFTAADFAVFEEPTLTGHMNKIKTVIDPKFVQLSQHLQSIFTQQSVVLYDHVAKHMRRTVNPPVDTWIAFGPHKRGYKKDPHLEIGLWPDAIFVWLMVLREGKQHLPRMVESIQASVPLMQAATSLQLSTDHTTADSHCNTPEILATTLQTFGRVPRAEFLIGHVWSRRDFLAQSEVKRQQFIDQTVSQLLPIYQSWLITDLASYE